MMIGLLILDRRILNQGETAVAAVIAEPTDLASRKIGEASLCPSEVEHAKEEAYQCNRRGNRQTRKVPVDPEDGRTICRDDAKHRVKRHDPADIGRLIMLAE